MLLGDYWNVIGFPRLKNKREIAHTHTKFSRAKSLIIRLGRKYYKVDMNIIQ